MSHMHVPYSEIGGVLVLLQDKKHCCIWEEFVCLFVCLWVFFLSLGDAQYGIHVDSQLEMCSTVVNIHFIISTFCESDSCCLKTLDLHGGKFLSVVF